MLKVLALISIFAISLFAAGDATFEGKRDLNIPAIIMFFVFIAGTLGITYWAARKTKSASDFYTAGGGISGFQNGLAIAGDYMSAAAFLGVSGLIYMSGYDGVIYAVSFLVGWPVILFFMAEKLRNLGKFTFADIAAYRLGQKEIRTLAAFGSLSVVVLYLIAQMVGAGKLIQILFGMEYEYAVFMVGALMIIYVTFGGMLATTWVQIIKAILLLSGVSFMAVMILYHFEFSFESLAVQAVEHHKNGEAILKPGGFLSDPISAISLGMALMLGTAGLPHVLMRFFTIAFLNTAEGAQYFDGAKAYLDGGKLFGGSNMASVHLSHMLGGNAFLGFISAVAFATILAVVSGLTLAGASAISHDIYANVINPNATDEQVVKISKITVIIVGIVGVTLGIAFESQNIAYMVGLAFGIAASANFPILFLSIYWSQLTTRGAFIGGFMGLITAVVLVILGPNVWVQILGNEKAIFPYAHPALFSVTVAFVSIWFFSKIDNSEKAIKERALFRGQNIRANTGIGAAGAVSH